MSEKIIAVDFDGTLCDNKWPDIGKANTEVIDYLVEQRKNGAKLILWTCRTGELLLDAVNWCFYHGLTFNTVNENLPEVIESMGGDTRKIFANEYIDDRMCTKFDFHKKDTEKKIHKPLSVIEGTNDIWVFCEELLTDDTNGDDVDTFGILYVIFPNGDDINIGKYYKLTENCWAEIDVEEYSDRMLMNKKLYLN